MEVALLTSPGGLYPHKTRNMTSSADATAAGPGPQHLRRTPLSPLPAADNNMIGLPERLRQTAPSRMRGSPAQQPLQTGHQQLQPPTPPRREPASTVAGEFYGDAVLCDAAVSIEGRVSLGHAAEEGAPARKNLAAAAATAAAATGTTDTNVAARTRAAADRRATTSVARGAEEEETLARAEVDPNP
jgi:hypothetical protein